MNYRFFFISILSCLMVIVVSFPLISQDIKSLPNEVAEFYISAGNFYLYSFSGSFSAIKKLMIASASFYEPLPSSVAFSYMQFGEVLIGAAEQSVFGLASIGNLVLGGADRVLFK